MQVSMSITKETDFQGKLDQFSNVYEFTGVDGAQTALNALADAVVALERPIFGDVVRFKRVRIWGGAGLDPTTMLLTKDLVGTGSAGSTAAQYAETAIMIRWPLPFRTSAFASTTNTFRRVSHYLRKYLHTCTLHGYEAGGRGAGFTPVAPNPLVAYATGVLTPVTGVQLCAPNGDVPTAGPTYARYLEHRQFPRGRKE